jgi:glycosyltransferase involved in cell wall biosynthesis
MSDVTVIISNYNYGRYLSASVTSCLSQTVPVNVIIVDDASTDKSWKIARRFAEKHSNIRAARIKKNSGCNARGKNVGITMCDTEYVMCLDSDDALLPTFMSDLLPAMQGRDWAHGIARRIETVDPKYDTMMGYDWKVWRRYNEFRGIPDGNPIWIKCIEASTVLVRRKLYEKHGLFNEKLKWKIDREMWSRFFFHGEPKRFVDRHVSLYRNHRQQITRNPGKKNVRATNAKYEKIVAAYGTNKDVRQFPVDYDWKSIVREVVG